MRRLGEAGDDDDDNGDDEERRCAIVVQYVKGIIILQVTVSLLWCAAFFAAKALDCTVHVGAYSVFVVSTISTYSEYLSNK
jgi:hypothetical protein